MIVGAVLVLCWVGLLGGSSVALWAQASRHGGYADIGSASYSVPGHAIASDTIGLHLATGVLSGLIGMVRIQVTQASGTGPAFVGIAPADAAARYLPGVDYATVHGAAGHHGTYTEQAGSAPAEVNVAATLPALPWIATGLLIGGIIFLIGGILLIVIPLQRASGH